MAGLGGVRAECMWETCIRIRGQGRHAAYGTAARRLGNEGLSAFIFVLAMWVAWDLLMARPLLFGVFALYLLVFADNICGQWWLMRSRRADSCRRD